MGSGGFIFLLASQSFFLLLKRVNPTAGSPTVTLLRLRPSQSFPYNPKNSKKEENSGWALPSLTHRIFQIIRGILANFCSFQDIQQNEFPGRDGRCVQSLGTNSPRHSDPRLLVIPASCCRVADNNPN